MSEPGRLMAAEMAEQPEKLAALIERHREVAQQVKEVVPRPLAGTALVARGSSDHAATCGAYLIEIATHRPVAMMSPSVITLYQAETDFSGYLVIAVSQSGHTPEIVEVTERARQKGACTLAFTNDPGSPLAQAAQLVVDLGAGPELAVPATKTVTAELAAFALVAGALGDIGLAERSLRELPDQVAGLLEDPGPAEAVAEWASRADRMVTVARGILYGAAREVALKIEETTALFTAGYSAADLRHGPIAIAPTGPPVLGFAHPGPAADDVIALVSELGQRGATARLAGPVAGSTLPWPSAAPEALAPVLAVVRGQQVALALAKRLGRDPDNPPGLNKVTAT
jgi:glucosamine--fructose-6-phosphate aminotransferase (isomerizing)